MTGTEPEASPFRAPHMAARFKNQSGIINQYALADWHYTIIGCGAIGSFLGVTLAKMGVQNVHLQDMDTIEQHNIANQMFPECSVGQKKVDVLKDMMMSYNSEMNITTSDRKFEDGDTIGSMGLVLCCVDNMDVRKYIYTASKDCDMYWFLDARMGAEVLRVYTVALSDEVEQSKYEETLYTAAEATEERCTQKSIIYTVLFAAAVIAGQIKKIVGDQRYPIGLELDLVNWIVMPSYKDDVPLGSEEEEETIGSEPTAHESPPHRRGYVIESDPVPVNSVLGFEAAERRTLRSEPTE